MIAVAVGQHVVGNRDTLEDVVSRLYKPTGYASDIYAEAVRRGCDAARSALVEDANFDKVSLLKRAVAERDEFLRLHTLNERF